MTNSPYYVRKISVLKAKPKVEEQTKVGAKPKVQFEIKPPKLNEKVDRTNCSSFKTETSASPKEAHSKAVVKRGTSIFRSLPQQTLQLKF